MDIVTGSSRIERYLAHLDELSVGAEPEFWPVESTRRGVKGLTAIGYRDLPETGLFLGFTYGLSLAQHERWQHGKPELCICVRSENPSWVLAVAAVAEHLRGDCPFQYGDVVDFGEPIAPDTTMEGFVVFAPSVVDADDARIDVGDGLPINLTGMYPTYRTERQFIRDHGLQAFWRLEWDPYDPARPPAV